MTGNNANAKSAAENKRLHEEKPQTLGEELFLIHLKRQRELDANDFDREYHPHSRKRAHSVGEELWEIHLKRVAGMPHDNDDIDVEHMDGPSSVSSKDAEADASQKEQQVSRRAKTRTMSLRNRQVDMIMS